MPKFECTSELATDVAADVLVAGAFADDDGFVLKGDSEEVDKFTSGGLRTLLESTGFGGKIGDIARYPATGDLASPMVTVVGMGAPKDVDAQVLRQVGAVIASSCRKTGHIVTSIQHLAPRGIKRPAAVGLLVEGMGMGGYEFVRYKKDPEPPKLKKITFAKCEPCRAEIRSAEALVAAVNWARDLVNEPAGSQSPRTIASEIKDRAGDAGLAFELWDPKRLSREHLGGVIGVGAGSVNEPCLVRLEYKPRGRNLPRLCLVGKGVIFDSGGLSLKPADAMDTMKTDMSGAAAVVATMSALKALGIKAHVISFTPFVENMPSGSATKPGDVLRFRNGKTAEIMNTDAEGRLILADALVLASEEKPDAIVDLATLTGACMIALGHKIFGVMGNDDRLVRSVLDAAKRSGERGWQLPLPADYKRQIESKIADMKNIGNRYGGALTAGLFLQEFVDSEIPWAHLDIAGPARAEADEFEVMAGGTGVGVRTLLNWIEHYEKRH